MKIRCTKEELIKRWKDRAETTRDLLVSTTLKASERRELEKQALVWECCALDLEMWEPDPPEK